MITKLSVQNFQSHANTHIDFVPGINVIVGSSDAGKSALLRAIRWIIFNRPLGTNIIRQGTEECEVELQTSSGVVKKYKGRENYYEVNSEIFRACGNSVPDTVKTVIDITDINCLGQFDGYYLVFESSGEIAKELNKALNIDLIDMCVSSCNSSIREYNSLIKTQTKQQEVLTSELDKYKDLTTIELSIDKYLQKADALILKRTNLTKLETLLTDIVNTKAALFKTDCNMAVFSEDLLAITDLVNKYDVKYSRYKKLCALCEDIEKVKQFITSAEENIRLTINEINFKKTQYKEKLKQLDICPFCNRKMTQSVCDHLSRRLE
jgi:exonuclease SbcC